MTEAQQSGESLPVITGKHWVETFDVRYFDADRIADSLRLLADELETDDNLVLIGLWNIDPGRGFAEGWLQVVLSRQEEVLPDGTA